MSRIKVNSKQARALGIPVPPKKRPSPEARKVMLELGVSKRHSPRKADEEFRRTAFLAMCRSHGINEPVPEFVFSKDRGWRFDWAWYWLKIALEIQGGLWVEGGGRHQRGAALLDEQKKLTEAAILGWRILYCTPEEVTTGDVFPLIRRALGLPANALGDNL